MEALICKLEGKLVDGDVRGAEDMYKDFASLLPKEVQQAFELALFKKDLELAVLHKKNVTVDHTAQFHALFAKEV